MDKNMICICRVFQNFANFYVALSGLATLSKSLEKKYGIPKFSSSGRRTVVGHDAFYDDNTKIFGYREDDFGFDFEFMNDMNLERANTSLDFAFEKLITFNSQFLKEILEAFETYERKNNNDLLNREWCECQGVSTTDWDSLEFSNSIFKQ